MTMLDHHPRQNDVIQEETKLQQVAEQQNHDKHNELGVSTTSTSGSHSSSSSSSSGSSLLQSRLWSTTAVKSLSIAMEDNNDNDNDFDDRTPFQIVMDSPDFQNSNNLPTTNATVLEEEETTDVSIAQHNKNLVQVKTLVWEVIWMPNKNEKYQHQQNDMSSSTSSSTSDSHPNHPPPQTTYIVTALRMEDQVDILPLEQLLLGVDVAPAHSHDTDAQSSLLWIPTITGLAPRPVAEQLTGYESGTMAPICHSTSMDLYVDQSLFVPQHNKILETTTTATGVQASMGSGTKGYSLIMTFKDMMKVARETSKQVKVGSFIRRTGNSSNVTTTAQNQPPRKQKSSSIPPPYTTLRRRGQKQHAHQAPPKDRLHEYRSLTCLEDKAKLLRSTIRKQGRFPEVRNLIEEACARDEFVDLMYVDPLDGKPAKNAFHLAAWKGDLESVMLLVETSQAECPELDLVNRVSTGIGSYGKTPLFYALTQCRDDVVRYLLDKGGASLLIVNNKGQTPCSIAISHLTTETCEYMQKLEAQQLQHVDATFQNYRLTHSDEKLYGDLDPRFPLDIHNRGEDIQEKLTAYHRSLDGDENVYSGIPTSFHPRSLRPTTRWWNRQDQSLEAANRDTSGTCITFTQPRPLTNKTKTKQQHQQRSPEVNYNHEQRKQHHPVAPSIDVESLQQLVLDDVLLLPSANKNKNNCEEDMEEDVTVSSRHLHNITYVADLKGIQELATTIDECIIQNGRGGTASNQIVEDDDDFLLVKSSCWGLDCEWKPGLDYGKFSPVATLQLSTRHRSFLVDLQVLCRSSSSYGKEKGLPSITTTSLTVLEQTLSDVLTNLFANPHIPILGYGVLQDLTKLAGSFPHLPCFALYHNVIDLQGLSSHVYPTTSGRRRGGQPQQQMSSLQRMVAILVGKRLDKSEQCSDWSRRPLSKEQLEYATLDAAVLPLLFNTMMKEPTFQKIHEGKFFQRNTALRSSLRYTVLERIQETILSDYEEEEPVQYHVPHGTAKVSMSIRLARQSWPTKESPPELPKRLGRTGRTPSLPFAAVERPLVAEQGETTMDLQHVLQPPKSKPPKRRPPPVQLSVMTGDLENLPVSGTFIGYTKESCIFRILGADQISALPKHTYIGFNRRSGIVETTNAWILFVNFGQRSNDHVNTNSNPSCEETSSSSSTNLFNQFICGGKQLNFSVRPTRMAEKSLIDYYGFSLMEKDIETAKLDNNNRMDTEKVILLFARPSTRTRYIFCGECQCKRVSTCADHVEDNDTVDMLLELMDFSKCVGQADYIHAFGQSHLDLE